MLGWIILFSVIGFIIGVSIIVMMIKTYYRVKEIHSDTFEINMELKKNKLNKFLESKGYVLTKELWEDSYESKYIEIKYTKDDIVFKDIHECLDHYASEKK